MQVCQSEDYFDCFPAVQAAVKYAIVFSNGGVDEEEEERKKREEEAKGEKSEESEERKVEKKVEQPLQLEEFRMFLFALKQYYTYCQVLGGSI